MVKEDRRLWFRESAWIYPEDDKKFIEHLTTALKENGFSHAGLWQNKSSGKYPQYLCSCDLGVGGDTVHFWRDGQSWWPMSGDYSCKQEDNAELILRETIIKFLEEKGK